MIISAEQKPEITGSIKINLLFCRVSAALLSGAIVSVIGSLVLIGWLFEVDFLKRLIPGYVFMNPTVAVALILSSISLWLMQSRKTATIRLAKALAVIIALIGVLKLCAIAGFFDTGIDRILFRSQQFDTVTGRLNQMSPNTGLNLLLFGAALLLLNSKRRNLFPSQYLVIVVILTTFLSIIGYFYGAKAFFAVVSFNLMALHTAVLFFTLAVGLLLSRPEQGLIKDLLSREAGGEMARRLFPLVIVIPAILGFLELQGEKRNLYQIEMGNAMLVVAIIFILGKIILNNAGSMNLAASRRRQTEELMRQSEEKYRNILGNIEEGYFEIDLNGNLTFFNDALCPILGYSANQAQGINYRQYVDGANGRKLLFNLLKIFKTGLPISHLDWEIIRSDNTRGFVESSISLIRDISGEPTGFRGLVRDVTGRKRAEIESKVISEIIQGVTTTSNLDELFIIIYQSLKKVLYAENCFVALYDKKTELLNMRFFVDKYDTPPPPFKLGRQKTAYVFRHGCPILMNHEMVRELTEQGEIEPVGTAPAMWLGVPLRTPKEITGVLVVQHYEDENAYSQRDLDFLTSVGNQIALAIERKRDEEKLRSSEMRLAEAQRIARIGSFQVELATGYVEWSDEMWRIFGLEPGENGLSLEDYISHVHPDDRAFVRSSIEKSNRDKKVYDFHHRIIRPDGEMRVINNSGKFIFNEEGTPVKITGIHQDITEQDEMEKELRIARDAALESVRLKSEFLANMSHEIRTPMNGVIGMTGLLLDTDLSERQQEYTKAIETSADALLTIIDDILDFSKIEAGQLRFETIDFDLRETVEMPVEMLAERAQAKNIEIASLVYREVPTDLRGDPGRLRQILTNLIGNAVKFTQKGEVVVRVRKESETKKHVVVRFEIKDTGIGIAEDAQRKLFSAFVQADGSTTRKYGGTGLGLAISKQLVELMGGEIGVESAAGEGSTFWFTARFEKQLAPVVKELPASAANLDGMRVLIVDDNETNRKILLHQTASWGMNGVEAESGAQALELLSASEKPFDIAILDLMMPEMDGFELARAIKNDSKISRTRLLLLPSFGKIGYDELAREIGIAAYLQKPVRQSQLYNCLVKLITGKPVNAGNNGSPRRIAPNSSRRAENNAATSKIRILIAEDNAINREVALSQLQSLGYLPDTAMNGLEAVEALKNQKYDVVLMDCQMPEMDGFEATAEIRRLENNSNNTPIIAMTANALEGDREKCLAAGMNDYLSKPVKIETLRKMLERWTSPANEPAKETPEKAETKKDLLEAIDVSVLNGYRALQQPGKPDLVEKLINLFIEGADKNLSSLRASVTNGNTEAIKRGAHSIKGSAGNIGARQMAALCLELEQKAHLGDEAESLVSQLEVGFKHVSEVLNGMRQK
ncbi:MAG: response regulator [Pyrinomonadaceae bacterium]